MASGVDDQRPVRIDLYWGLAAACLSHVDRQLKRADVEAAGANISARRRVLAIKARAARLRTALMAIQPVIQQRHWKEKAMSEATEGPTLFADGYQATATNGTSWPGLSRLRLQDKEVEGRRSGLGGSDANIILSGNRDRILDLWREKRGEQPAVDLSSNLAVMLGCWTEAFNRQWFEQITGRAVDQVQVCLECPTNSWRRCTLDGYISDGGVVWEAKHTNAFSKADEILDRYMPQLQHNMAVARAERAVLSVIFGNHRFEWFEVASDWVYQIELLQAEVDFWDCVETGRRPLPAPPPAVPRPISVREVCLDGNNQWAAAAFDWLENREAAKRHATACATIKELVEPDVARAFGHGIEAKRSKAGAVSIREIGA